MLELDNKSGEFIVEESVCGTTPQDMVMEVVGLRWLVPPPFMAPNKPKYEITLRNHYGALYNEISPGKESCTVGNWVEPWHDEGDWTGCPIAPCSTETFVSDGVRIPAWEGAVGGTLHMGQCLGHPAQYLPGLAIWTVQNPDALSPPQSPPRYSNWSGLKEFPVPHSPYSVAPGLGVYYESVRLPMLSASHPVTGEITVRLISPKDHAEWADKVGRWSKTEYRISGIIDLSEDYWYAAGYPDVAYEYNFYVGYDAHAMRQARPFTKVLLTKADDSGLFTFPVNLERPIARVGDQVTVHFSVDIYITGGQDPYDRLQGSHPLFFCPDVHRHHRFVCVGYVNVGG